MIMSIRKMESIIFRGLNNPYLVNTQHMLALRYNDKSVLESHHVAATFALLKKPECNIFDCLNKEDLKVVRNFMIEMILHTDMAHHF
jgi:cAMP-specific phosphodiesterase 4